MSPEHKQDEVKNDKKEKRRTRRNPVSPQRTGSISNTKATSNVEKGKALPKVKHSFITQMASVEKDTVGEYLEKEKRNKKT